AAGVPRRAALPAVPPRGPGPRRAAALGRGVAARGRGHAPLGGRRRRDAPMSRLLIGVIGGSWCSTEEAEWAVVVGRLLAEQGAGLVCGGAAGVRAAGVCV